MRLIDADALVKWIERQKRLSKLCTIMAIQETPTIDAVPVVRCKDCKYNPEFKPKRKGWVWCRNFRTEVEATGFCSYGKPRGERKE